MHDISIVIIYVPLYCFNNQNYSVKSQQNMTNTIYHYSHELTQYVNYKKLSYSTKNNCIMKSIIICSIFCLQLHNLNLSILKSPDTTDKIIYHKLTKNADVQNCPLSKHNYLTFNKLFSHQFCIKMYLIMLYIIYFQNEF